MSKSITERTVRALKPTSKLQEIRDTEVRGFTYRVNAARRDGSATRGYYVELGRAKRLKLGDAALLTPKRARNLARAVKVAVAEGRDPRKALREALRGDGAPASDELTLKEFLRDDDAATEQRYGRWVTRNRKTGKKTLDRLCAIFRPLELHTLDELRPNVIDRWRDDRAEHVKPVTINRDVAALKAALTKAVEWGYVKSHPLEGYKPMKTDQHRRARRALTPEEETRLFRALETREQRKRSKRASANAWRRQRGKSARPSLDGRFVDYLLPAVLVSLNTGLRRGELFHLEWRDVDFEAAKVTVRGEIAKNGQTRHIELNKTALSTFRRWKLQTSRQRLIFSGRDGARFQNLQKSYYAALKAANIDRKGDRGDVTWHSLRHTFGTRLAAAGVPPHTAQALMGHADLHTTMRYFHVTENERRSAVKRLDALPVA